MRFGLLLALSLTAFSLPAAAQPQPAEFSNEQFVTAKERFEKGDYTGALALFKLVHEQTGSPNARVYMARCLRELGKTIPAYEEMSAALKDAAAKAQTEPRYANTRDAAAAELALLDLRIGRLIIVADGIPGATVKLDDTPVPAERLGSLIPVEPGTRKLEASAEGQDDPVTREVTIAAGETKAVSLSFPSEGGSSGGVIGGSDGTVRTIGIVHASVGLVGMIFFTAFAVAADGKQSDLEEQCGEDVRCVDPSHADTVDEGKAFATTANVGLVFGIVGLSAGAVLIALDWPTDDDDGAEPKAAFTLQPAPGGGMLGVSGSF